MKHFLHTLMGCLLLVAMTACEKDTMAGIFAPEVETGTATNIYRKGATLSGSIRFTEGTVAEHYGILFSELQSMSEYREMKVEDEATDFNISVQDLEPGKTYYFCSYAHSGFSLRRGEVRNFTTSQSNAPVFDALTSTSQTLNGFSVSVSLLDDGGSELIMAGFCYNELGEKEPTFLDKVVNVEPNGSSFSAEVKGLEPNKHYQVRAYGASENGLAYSEMLVVSTEQAVVPYLSAISCKDSTATSISVTASVIDAGTSPVKELGFCYSSESDEPTKDSHNSIDLSDQKNNGEFSTIIGELIAGTTYYIRAYAVNAEGISYSDAVSYMPRSEVPTLSEISCQDSTATTIMVKASVLTEGTSSIKSVGFCYSNETQEPNREMHSFVELSDQVDAEEFMTTLEDFTPGTTYYIRAYAENSEGIGYSDVISFNPIAEVPTLSAVTTSDETPTSITVSASVLNVGTSAVTAIGFRYKAEGQENETVVDLSDQLGNESFNTIIEGLEPSTTYIIRAYAENSEGIGYSEAISYTPYAEVPTLSVITTSEPKPTSIFVSASVLDSGTSDIKEIGFAYYYGEMEVLIDLTEQIGNEQFSTIIEGLSPNSAYHIRAYAVNNEGIGYSESITYSPVSKVPTLSAIVRKDTTVTSITVSSSVLDVGTSELKSVGFIYARGEIETVIDLTDQLGNESFSTVIDNLELGDTYYIRAYAENNEGVGYSNSISYTTRKPGIYSLSDWREFCIAKNSNSEDLSKWVNTTWSGEEINIYEDLDFSEVYMDDDYILYSIDMGEILNGNNHIFSGIEMIRDYQASLIGENHGTIKNLHLGEGIVRGGMFSEASAAAICLENSSESVIIGCSSKINVSGTAAVGGICVTNNGDIIDCINWGNVETDSYALGNAVGIALGGYIGRCTNYGNIVGRNAAGIGGSWEIYDCVNYGTIGFDPDNAYVATAKKAAGISISADNIYNCINEGNIKAVEYAGGIVAELSYLVENCTNKGSVDCEGVAGGIVALVKKTGGCNANTNIGLVNGESADKFNMIGADERILLLGTWSYENGEDIVISYRFDEDGKSGSYSEIQGEHSSYVDFIWTFDGAILTCETDGGTFTRRILYVSNNEITITSMENDSEDTKHYVLKDRPHGY